MASKKGCGGGCLLAIFVGILLYFILTIVDVFGGWLNFFIVIIGAFIVFVTVFIIFGDKK